MATDEALTTIKRTHTQLDWLKSRPKYCQIIREANKELRKQWCEQMISNKEMFEDVIFSDECTVQLESLMLSYASARSDNLGN